MTAATIPKIKAVNEPVRMGASLDGAEVDAVAEAELVRVVEVWPDVCALDDEVSVAVLKVEFRVMAVPVPEALAMLVMLMVLFPAAVEVDEDEDEPEPPWMVNWPE